VHVGKHCLLVHASAHSAVQNVDTPQVVCCHQSDQWFKTKRVSQFA